MTNKILAAAAFILLVIIFQLSFINTLPTPVNNLNLVLGIVIYVALFNYRRALLYAFLFGIILDIYSFTGFGIKTLSLLLVVIAVNFLFNNLFTNRSFFSLVTLGIIATVGFEFLTFIFSNLYFYIKIVNLPIEINIIFFRSLAGEVVLNAAFLVFIVYFQRRTKIGEQF